MTNNCFPRDSIPFILTTPLDNSIYPSSSSHHSPDEKSPQKKAFFPFLEHKTEERKKKKKIFNFTFCRERKIYRQMR